MTTSTRAQLTTEFNANFIDNTTGAISALLARTTFADFVASFGTLGDTNTWTAANTWSGASTFAPTSGDAVAITPAAASTAKGLAVTQSGPSSGTLANAIYYNQFSITSKGISSSLSTFTNGWPDNGVAGVRIGFDTGTNNNSSFMQCLLAQVSVTSATNAQRATDAVVGAAYINVNNSFAGTELGGVRGYAICDSGGNAAILTGLNSETGILGTGTVGARTGITIDSIGTTVASGIDAAVVVTNYTAWNGSTNAGGFKDLFVISQVAPFGTGTPLQSTASFFRSDAAFNATNFANLPTVVFSGDYFNFTDCRLSATSGSKGWLILGRNDVPDAAFVVNLNNGTPVAPAVTSTMHLVAADAALNVATFDSFASQTIFGGRRANTTRASKSVSVANDPIVQISGSGWDGSAYGTASSITFFSTETFSGTAHGGRIDFNVVTNTTTTNNAQMRLHNSGGLVLGNAAIATDPGVGAFLANSSIKSQGATAGIGYATGAGGTVTQGAGSGKATAVTLNTATGAITMNNAALAAATIVTFVLNDSAIAATDYIATAHESGGTTGSYTINARATGSGTAAVDVRNNTAGSLSEAIVIRFSVGKSVNA